MFTTLIRFEISLYQVRTFLFFTSFIHNYNLIVTFLTNNCSSKDCYQYFGVSIDDLGDCGLQNQTERPNFGHIFEFVERLPQRLVECAGA